MWEASFHDCSTGPVSLGLNISSQEVLTLTSTCILIRQCLDGWALGQALSCHPQPAGKPELGFLWGAPPQVFQFISPHSLDKDKTKNVSVLLSVLSRDSECYLRKYCFENGLMLPLRKSAKTGTQFFTEKQSLKVESNAVLHESDTCKITLFKKNMYPESL